MVLFLFTIVLMIIEGRCDCVKSTYFTVCPFPLFLDARKDNRLVIGCSTGNKPSFGVLQVGRIINSELFAAAGSTSGQSPTLYTPSSSDKTFRPQGRPKVIGTDRNFSLILEAVAIQDLSSPWKCWFNYPFQTTRFSNIADVTLKVLAHPGDIQLVLEPDKDFYNRTDIVNLQCRANTAVVIDEQEETHYRFQYFSQGRWVPVNMKTRKEIASINIYQPVRRGDFIIQPYGISLKVSSIQGCSRRFRCFTFYGNKFFDKEAAESVISLYSSQCTSEKPDLGNPTFPPPVNGSNSTNSTIGAIIIASNDAQGSLLISKDLFLGIVISGSLLILAVVILIATLLRRHRKKLKKRAKVPQAKELFVQPASVFHPGPYQTGTVEETSSYTTSGAESTHLDDTGMTSTTMPSEIK